MKWELPGKFFHNFTDDDGVRNQGEFIAYLNEDILVVTYFSFLDGSPTTHLVWLKEVVDGKWAFYDSEEEMKHAYDVRYGDR